MTGWMTGWMDIVRFKMVPDTGRHFALYFDTSSAVCGEPVVELQSSNSALSVNLCVCNSISR